MIYKDNKNRCKWCNPKNELYIKYHDKEWGQPSYEDKYLFEMLILESFQAGLSWECVLNKRKAFDNFDIDKICNFDDKKIKELLENPNIIRNKLKINAAINNSKIFKEIQKEYKTFFQYAILAFLLAFLPFLFFENGFENIGQLYENVKEQTAIYGMSFSVYRFGIIPLFLQLGKTLNIENQFILYETGKYLTYILGLLSTGLFFTTKSSLIRFGLAAMICVLVPQQAFVYNGIYIFPLLIMLLSANSKLSSIETCLTLFLFIWILLPVQLNKFTPKINNISMILMWVLFISIAIRQYLLNKKNNLNSSSKER